MPVSPWASALQNMCALMVTGWLAREGVIKGEMAAAMILGILGVIAIPAFRGKPPGSVGVFVLLSKPALHAAATVAAVLKGPVL